MSGGGVGRRIRVARPSLPALERYVEELGGIWERGMLSNDGPCARGLEREFADYSGVRSVLAASNADVALALAVAALELPRGAVAALPSFGYPSTVHALEWNGLKPRFVDVDTDDWCLHPEQLEGHTADVSLVLATHMFGAPCEVAGLQQLTRELRVPLVYDAAQAVATWVGDVHVTSFGDASVVSLGGTKVVTSAEGALVTLADPGIAERFARLRSYGMGPDGISERLGLNAKLSELHAALGRLSLAGLDEQLSLRRALIDRYRAALEHRPDIRLQRHPSGTRSTPGFFVIEVGEVRDGLRAALETRGIESRPYFPALHLMRRFAHLAEGPLPVSERLSGGLLSLPLYAELEPSIVDGICVAVCEALDELHDVEG